MTFQGSWKVIFSIEVDMKKFLLAAIAVVAALCLFSCGGDGKKEEETTVKTDWRNTIEYEGAFFVNESKRVLYALDTGSITQVDRSHVVL